MLLRKNRLKRKISFYFDVENSLKGGISVKKQARNASDMFFEHEDVMVFVFGNLFNEELKRYEKGTFLKKLILNYKKDDIKMLEKSQGIFHIIFFNKKKNTITLVSDKLGLFPVYIFRDNASKIRIAFSIESLLKNSQDHIHTLNLESIKEFLKYGFIFDGKTFVNKINRIKPGLIITIGLDKMVEKKYYSMNITKMKSIDRNAIEDFKKLFESAVDLRIKKDVSLRLTGGWDTRLILAAIKSLRKLKKIKAYTDPPNDNKEDWYIASLIARNLKIKHRSFDYSDSILNGLLGGEMLALNLNNRFFRQIDNIEREKYEYIKKIRIKDDFNKQAYVFIDSVLRSHLSTIVEGWSRVAEKYFIYNESFPFLDTSVIEWVLSHDHKELMNYKTYYLIYRQCYPEFLKYPWTTKDSIRKPNPPIIKDVKIDKMKFIKDIIENFVFSAFFSRVYSKEYDDIDKKIEKMPSSDIEKRLSRRYPKPLIKSKLKEMLYLEEWLKQNKRFILGVDSRGEKG